MGTDLRPRVTRPDHRQVSKQAAARRWRSALGGSPSLPSTRMTLRFCTTSGTLLLPPIRAAAHDSGVVQVRGAIRRSDPCSSSPWFYPLSAGFPPALHPTATGQEEMAKELRGAAGPPP